MSSAAARTVTTAAAASRAATQRPRVAPARPVAEPARQGYLRLVPQARSSAARAPFVVLVVAALTAGLLGLLVLNTALAQGAFRLHALATAGSALNEQEQGLAREVGALQAPAVLAQRATALGMVPGGAPAFLRLSDGAILGEATAAPAPSAATPSVSATPGSTAPSGPATGEHAGASSPVTGSTKASAHGPAKATAAGPSKAPAAAPSKGPAAGPSKGPAAGPSKGPGSQSHPTAGPTPAPRPSGAPR